jgi:hypothetical protein
MNYECPECESERFRFHNMRVHLKVDAAQSTASTEPSSTEDGEMAHGYSAQDVMEYEDEVTV